MFSTPDEKIVLELVTVAETELKRGLKAGTWFGTSDSRESELQVRHSPLADGGSTASPGNLLHNLTFLISSN